MLKNLLQMHLKLLQKEQFNIYQRHKNTYIKIYNKDRKLLLINKIIRLIK